MIIDLILAWIFILIIFFGVRETFGLRKENEEDKDETANQVIRAEYQKLGTITFAEVGGRWGMFEEGGGLRDV